MPFVKKCQTEQPVDINQIGGDFRWQPATFDNPANRQYQLAGCS